jgi:hypothetical protein
MPRTAVPATAMIVSALPTPATVAGVAECPLIRMYYTLGVALRSRRYSPEL